MALQGFSRAKSTSGHRLILNIEGMEGKGKSSLALSAPDPIALFDFDTGLEGVIEKILAEGRDILVPDESLKHRDVTTQADWGKMWDAFVKMYARALNSKDIRTVVIDTGTEAWELARLAAFGQLSQVQPHHYGPVNADFRRLIKRAFDSDKNLIITHKLKPRYVDNKRTKDYDMSGFNDMPYIAQVTVRVWRHRRAEDDDVDFGLTFRKCRPNADLEETELVQPMSTFQFLASEVFPDTEPEDWE